MERRYDIVGGDDRIPSSAWNLAVRSRTTKQETSSDGLSFETFSFAWCMDVPDSSFEVGKDLCLVPEDLVFHPLGGSIQSISFGTRSSRCATAPFDTSLIFLLFRSPPSFHLCFPRAAALNHLFASQARSIVSVRVFHDTSRQPPPRHASISFASICVLLEDLLPLPLGMGSWGWPLLRDSRPSSCPSSVPFPFLWGHGKQSAQRTPRRGWSVWLATNEEGLVGRCAARLDWTTGTNESRA